MKSLHGFEGWVLEDYSWDEGIGTFEYSRKNPETGLEEGMIVERVQP